MKITSSSGTFNELIRPFPTDLCFSPLSVISPIRTYSSGTSGKGEDVDRVKKATDLVKESHPELKIEGPIQYDAAVDADCILLVTAHDVFKTIDFKKLKEKNKNNKQKTNMKQLRSIRKITY